MADHDNCDDCIAHEDQIVSSTIFSRKEALGFYIQLQEQGFCPAMCEGEAGKFRVCYAGNRPTRN